MEPNSPQPQPIPPASQPAAQTPPGPQPKSNDAIRILLFVLAGLVLVGMLLPRTFHSILIYPLLIFALLAAKNFYDDTQKQVPARDKTVHVFKTLVKVGLITVGVIIGFIILIIAAFAQSGV